MPSFESRLWIYFPAFPKSLTFEWHNERFEKVYIVNSNLLNSLDVGMSKIDYLVPLLTTSGFQ